MKMLKEIYIIGAGGFGKEVAETIEAMNRQGQRFRIAGYIDDDPDREGETLNGIKIFGSARNPAGIGRNDPRNGSRNDPRNGSRNDPRSGSRGGSAGAEDDAGALPSAVIAVSDPVSKARIAKAFDGYVTWESVIHPSANISPYATIGRGVVIQSFVYVAPNAVIEDHAHVNVLSSIGHDARLGAFASVMVQSALSGHVTVERYGYVATGVTVLPGVRIGENARVGAGSTVTNDIPADVVAYGSPCRVIRAREDSPE